MRVAVKDTSILIDLAEGDLLGRWFELRIETHTTDFVLAELRREEQWRRVSGFVDEGLIRRHVTPPDDIAGLVDFSRSHGVSLADASGVLLAHRLKADLLTGDRRMRSVAGDFEVKVRGLLWVIDQLVEREFLSGNEAADRLERIRAAGSHLPHEECAARIRSWRG